MIDKDEITIVKIVGSRMAEARGICKLQRHVAAGRLGISDSYLARVENGIDIETIPLKLIQMASLVYDVSCEFLFNFSSDWEVAEESKLGRDIGAWIHHENKKMFSQWAVQQMALERQLEAVTTTAHTLHDEIEAVVEALTAFKQLNSGFDRLPAGSQLQYRISRAGEKAQEARQKLIKVPT